MQVNQSTNSIQIQIQFNSIQFSSFRFNNSSQFNAIVQTGSDIYIYIFIYQCIWLLGIWYCGATTTTIGQNVSIQILTTMGMGS